MNDKDKLEAVYNYVRNEELKRDDFVQDFKVAFICSLIILPILVIGGFLLQRYAPEFWERLLKVLEYGF